MTKTIQGNQVLMVTPFTDDYEIDEASTRALVDFIIEGGAHGIIALGTTGEFFSLSPDEKRKMVDIVIDQGKGRIPILFGCADSGTKQSIQLAQYAESKGADAILLPPPYYFPFFENDIEEHFIQVAKSINIPVMAYDGGGGREIPISMLLNLNEKAPNIKYAKITTRKPEKIKQILSQTDKIGLFCGDEPMTLFELRDGASGMTLGAGNIQPKEVSQIYEEWKKGNHEKAREIFYQRLMPQVGIFNIELNKYIQCFKETLVWMKIIKSPKVRPPLTPLSETRREEAKAVMQYLKII